MYISPKESFFLHILNKNQSKNNDMLLIVLKLSLLNKFVLQLPGSTSRRISQVSETISKSRCYWGQAK